MKKPKTSILLLALLASFAFGPATSAQDLLSVESQRSLEPTHQRLEGFEPGHHPRFFYFSAKRRAASQRLNSMTPEQRQSAREKFEHLTPEERAAAVQEIRDRNQERIKEQTL